MALTRGACTGQARRIVLLERRLVVLARRPVTSVRALEGEGEAVWPPPPDELLRGAFPQDWRVFRARLVQQEQDARWSAAQQAPRDATQPRGHGEALTSHDGSAAGQPCAPATPQDPSSVQQQQQQQQQRPRRSTTPSRKGSRGGQPWAAHARHRPLWGQQPHHRQQQQHHHQQQQPAPGDVNGLQKPPARRDPSLTNSGAAKRPSPPRLPFPAAVPSLNVAGSSDGALGAAPLGASASPDLDAASQAAAGSSCCGGGAPKQQSAAGGTARSSSTPQPLHGSSSPSSALADPVELLGADVSAALWAHALAAPEVGCVLVARQDVDPNTLGLFHRAVVLITSHDPVYGTVGLILNKPSPLTVGELSTASAEEGFQQVFGEQRLHLGGPVHLDHITLLHPFMGLRGAVQVAEGLYTGGLPDAVLMVQAGLAHASQFVLSLGMSGWAPKQLERELEAGCWHCVAAAPELLLPRLTARRATAATRPPNAGSASSGPSTARLSSADAPASAPQGRRPSPTPKASRWDRQPPPAPASRGVPPLQPPPQHPVQAMNEACLWWQLLQVAHLA